MNSQTIPDEPIVHLCTRILPEFRKIMLNLEALDHNLSWSGHYEFHLSISTINNINQLQTGYVSILSP